MPFTSTSEFELSHLLLKSVASGMFVARIPRKENSVQLEVKGLQMPDIQENPVLDLVGLHAEIITYSCLNK